MIGGGSLYPVGMARTAAADQYGFLARVSMYLQNVNASSPDVATGQRAQDQKFETPFFNRQAACFAYPFSEEAICVQSQAWAS